jgi:hypothetical protein
VRFHCSQDQGHSWVRSAIAVNPTVPYSLGLRSESHHDRTRPNRRRCIGDPEEFNALIQEYDNRDVVVRAVTGILATTAYAASNSPGEARELVNAIAVEAREAIDAMYEIEKPTSRSPIDRIEPT